MRLFFYIFTAMAFLITLLFIFFWSSNLEATYSHRSKQKHHVNIQIHHSDVQIQSPVLKSFKQPQLAVYNVTISKSFVQTIPQNGAYWNRLLYLALKYLHGRENPARVYSHLSNCDGQNAELLQTNMNDYASYPVMLKNFVQGMTCKSYPVRINQPDKCNTGEGDVTKPPFLLFAIKSMPQNFEQRQALRETWAREEVYQRGLRVSTVFLLGNTPPDAPNLSPLLSFEAEYYRDLLQWDFNESLMNLTLKTNMFLQWTLKHCPRVSFIFSGDDDIFVNTPALLSYLHSLDTAKATKLYVGQIINQANPQRNSKSKYYIPLSFFDGRYTSYAGGAGYVFSGKLLQPLYSVSQVIPFFPFDDVHTGMCFLALEVSPEAHAGFRTFDIKEEYHDNLCIHKELIMIHQRSPKQIKKLWNGIDSPLLIC